MKIQGLVTGIIRDAETGEIKRTFEEKNAITENFLSQMSEWTTGGGWNNRKFGPYVFVSSKNYPSTNRWDDYIWGIEAVGYTESGISQPRQLEFATNDSPTGPWGWYYEFQQRFSPPTSTRTIRVVGLSPVSTGDAEYTNYRRLPAQAWVRLTTDCIQEPTETLDIFYRVQFLADYGREDEPVPPQTTTKLSLNDVYPIFRRHTDGWDGYLFLAANMFWNGRRIPTKTLDYTLHQYGVEQQFGSFSKAHIPSLRKTNIITSYGINDGIGRIVGTLAYGYYSSERWSQYHKHILRATDTPIQNIFGHSSTATKPFYDSTTAQVGNGRMTVDGSGWTNPDYSKLYRIDITNSGGVGAATYKLSVRDQFGFRTNTYLEHAVYNPVFQTHNVNELCKGMQYIFDDDGHRNKVETWIKYDKKRIVGGGMFTPGLAVTDVVSGETIRFNSTTTPALPTTDIGQYEVDRNGAIWVACRATGAYRINPSFTTITKFDNTTPGLTGLTTSKCYGIAPGVGNRVWAVFDGGFFYTDDFGASWTQATVTFTTITADWTKVKFLKADPTNTDHRLAFAYDAGSGNLTISWWNLTTSTNVQGPLISQFNTSSTGYMKFDRMLYWTRPVQYFMMLQCSPNQGVWGNGTFRASSGDYACNSAIYTFNSTSYITRSVGSNPNYTALFHTAFGVAPTGNDALFTFGDSTYATIGLIEQNGTVHQISNLFSDTSYDGFGNHSSQRGFITYMGDGVWLVNYTTCLNYCSQHQQIRLCTMHDPNSPLGGIFRKTLWKEYGWDGSQWVLGHSGSKTVHSTPELLNDGLTIAFDDESGTRTFNATDYYTFGVVDGIQQDGATAMTHKTSIYYKPTIEGVTDIESPILPAITRAPLTTDWKTSFTWRDVANLTSGTNVIRRSNTSTSFNSGARSNEPVRRHNNIIDPSLKGTVGRVEFRVYTASGFENTTAPNRVLVGLSDSSVVGTAISYNSPQFAILIDGSTHLGSYNATMYAVWSGTTVQTLGVIDTNLNQDGQYFRVIIMADGSIRYDHYQQYWQGWSIIWQSAPGVAPVDRDYYIDAAFAGQASNSGIEDIRMDTHHPDDYYTMFGNSINQSGRWHPQWFAVDYDHNFEVKIDGILATNIGNDNTTTALQTGQISVHPTTGMIRYSAADAGKTMTARYTTIVHE